MISPVLEKTSALPELIKTVGKLWGWYGGVAVWALDRECGQAVLYTEEAGVLLAYSSMEYLKSVDGGELAMKLAVIKGEKND